MEFRWHFLIGLLLFSLYPVLRAKVLIVFLASLLIDVDHIYLVFKEKAFNFKRMKELSDTVHKRYAEDKENAFKDIFYLFHTAEFNVVLLALSFVYPLAFYILLGFVFHMLVDIIHYTAINGPILRWLSFVEFLRINSTTEG